MNFNKKTVIYICFIYLFKTSYSQLSGLSENDKCTNTDGTEGFCKKIDECTTVKQAIRAGKRPKICGFKGGDNKPIICCPPEPLTDNRQTPRGSISIQSKNPTEIDTKIIELVKRKCEEYSKSVIVEIDSPVLTLNAPSQKNTVNLCGRVAEPMVLGGEKAQPMEYPHMALIGYGIRQQWLCGGSLISERYVLSAAHCTKPPGKGEAMWVKLGELDQSSDFDDARPEIFRIIERINHPNYSSVNLYNDISLYKLDKDATFNGYIRPICLATEYKIPQNIAIATGWGHTSWGGRGSSSLMKVEVKTVENSNCNEKYESTRKAGKQIPQGILDRTMICAGDQLGKDTCQGDSGGPLQIPLREPYCMYNIIGVTSFGKGCGLGFPGVYTRVSNYIPWIVNIVWPNEF